MTANFNTRRLKILHIPQERILDGVAGKDFGSCHYVVGIGVESPLLPEGTRLVSVHPTWDRAGFACIVHHESFEEVPDGEAAPYILFNRGAYFVVRLVRKDGLPDTLEELRALREAVNEAIYDAENKPRNVSMNDG